MANAEEFLSNLLEAHEIDCVKGLWPSEVRRIIGGKTYNTETATKLASFRDNSDYDGWRDAFEDLYQTRNGAYFLLGKGGLHSPWSVHTNDGPRQGWALVPMHEREARQWCEVRGLHNAYVRLFGEPDEAGPGNAAAAEMVVLRLPPALARQVAASAEKRGFSIQRWIQEAVEKTVTAADQAR
jgi:hypothetical protein